jgi:hypothetical protein
MEAVTNYLILNFFFLQVTPLTSVSALKWLNKKLKDIYINNIKIFMSHDFC